MAFEIGKTAGGYEFLDVLDSTKTGVAYKVRNLKFGRVEMLRILPRNLQDDQERVERFLREVKVHARLSHPNLITFYNATEIDGQLVMTMDLVEGTPLAWRLELGPVPYPEAIRYMRQVLAALGYAHSQSIVHRDVTPANILITPHNRIMLAGFGMAKASTDPNLTRTGTAIGVAQYMSPEQVKGVTALDGRSDIYSLGVVLYEAITGRLPFNASSEFEIMLAHVNEVPKAPSSINPEIPEELDEIILTALAKDPSQRFQTVDEFSNALAEGETPGVSSPAPVSTVAAVRTNRAEGFGLPSTAAAQKKSGLPMNQWLLREWTFSELALGGVITSIVLTLVFIALMTMTGALPLTAGH
jgi:eukaryotic-like serine/threonine-protein kinase